jgi:hypothetical protein
MSEAIPEPVAAESRHGPARGELLGADPGVRLRASLKDVAAAPDSHPPIQYVEALILVVVDVQRRPAPNP